MKLKSQSKVIGIMRNQSFIHILFSKIKDNVKHFKLLEAIYFKEPCNRETSYLSSVFSNTGKVIL